MPPHVFSIDGRHLSYGRFAPAHRALELLEHRRVELPEDLLKEGPLGGVIAEPADLVRAIGELLEGISSTVDRASLILPDSWLRVAFAKMGDLPRSAAERDDVLRWQLKRLVPFRVEDLRLNAVEVQPLEDQEERCRVMLGFAMEHLLSHLEQAFGENGVRIGQISNRSLALLAGLRDTLRGVELGAFLYVESDAYTLVAARHGEPAVHRFKVVSGSLAADAREDLVRRDLRLTRAFLSEQIEKEIGRMVLVCPREWEESWRRWLEDVFEVAVNTLSSEWDIEASAANGAGAVELAPMFGAARRKVR